MDLRSVAGADAEIYALGVDVGGTALEVAQRGLSSMLSNRTPGLGRWSFDGPMPTLRIADDLVVHLLARERSVRLDRVVVGVSAPSWFGIGERTRLAEVIDPMARHEVVTCSSTVAAAVGLGLVGPSPLAPELLLVLDLDVGCAASVVEISPALVREWCTAGLSPQRAGSDGSNDGPINGPAGASRRCERVLAELLAQAEALGCVAVDRVVVVGDEVRDVERLLASAAPAWSSCPTRRFGGRSLVARGAAFLADPCGGLALLSSAVVPVAAAAGVVADPLHPIESRIDDRTERRGSSAGTPIEIVGALSKRVGVLMDDHDGAPIVHPVIERGHVVPSVHEQLFDLGPDDGSDVYLDVFEQADLSSDPTPEAHRLVATAHLRRDLLRELRDAPTGHTDRNGRNGRNGRNDDEAEVSEETLVTFEIRPDGRFVIGPAETWSLDWHRPEVDVVAVRPDLVDDRDPSRRSERAAARPLLAAWSTVAPRSPVVTPDPVIVEAEPVIVEAEPVIVEAEPVDEAQPVVTDPVIVEAEPVIVEAEPVIVEAEPVDEAQPVVTEPVIVEAQPVIVEAQPVIVEAQRVVVEAPEPVRPSIAPSTAAPSLPSAPPSTPSNALPSPLPLPPTPAIAAALQRCERLLSSEVGQMVALRSVFALLDLPDDAAPAELASAADRLERSLSLRRSGDRSDDAADDRSDDAARDGSDPADGLADALRRAIAATRQALRDGRTDWYFGGTEADVTVELSRVVEHLMVVVGIVSPAEQRRLVLDAQLLGLSAERAQARVRELVLQAQASRMQEQLPAADVGVRVVQLHPELRRFVLSVPVEAVPSGPEASDATLASGRHDDPPATTAGVRMRVLVDPR